MQIIIPVGNFLFDQFTLSNFCSLMINETQLAESVCFSGVYYCTTHCGGTGGSQGVIFLLLTTANI